MFTVDYVDYHVTDEHYTRVHQKSGSPDYTFLFFLSPMHVILSDHIEEAAPGSFVIFAPGDEQDYSALRDFKVSYFRFSCPFEDYANFAIPTNEVLTVKDPEKIDHFLSLLNTEYYTQNLFSLEAMDALAKQLFVYISREFDVNRLESEKEQKLYRLFLQARFTMLSNCESEWASTNMSQMVDLSRSQFYKYYTDFFGISPMEDLQIARIEKAKNLLLNSNLSVTEIATRCGYASIHHFSRTFKEQCGMSPLNYIKSLGKDIL